MKMNTKTPRLFLVILLFTFVEKTTGDFFEVLDKVALQFRSFLSFVTRTEKDFVNNLQSVVKFYLYTRHGEETELSLSEINKTLPIIILVHGYTDSKDRKIIANLRKALLDNLQVNVIVCDWQKVAAQIYFTVVPNTYHVGRFLGTLLETMEWRGFDLNNVHLIGHSLGAQICGVAGDKVNGRVGRITGLDPAGPLFEFVGSKNESMSLDKSDAQFVDIIHSAMGSFGVVNPIGHADFYPNEGLAPQPGCDNVLLTVSCSHIRSVEYFIESVQRNFRQFLAKRCDSWNQLHLTNCTRNHLVPMGYYTPTWTRGMFHLQTNNGYPFSMGNKFFKRNFVS